MEAEVIGIDHIYLAVGSMVESERFYDCVLVDVLGFRKNHFVLGDDEHVQYYNRQFGLVIRPARNAPSEDFGGAIGLHHFCFRVADEAAVDRVARALGERDVKADRPKYYPQYAADYYAIFFTDPDGIRLEVTNFRAERRARMSSWDEETDASS